MQSLTPSSSPTSSSSRRPGSGGSEWRAGYEELALRASMGRNPPKSVNVGPSLAEIDPGLADSDVGRHWSSSARLGPNLADAKLPWRNFGPIRPGFSRDPPQFDRRRATNGRCLSKSPEGWSISGGVRHQLGQIPGAAKLRRSRAGLHRCAETAPQIAKQQRYQEHVGGPTPRPSSSTKAGQKLLRDWPICDQTWGNSVKIGPRVGRIGPKPRPTSTRLGQQR